MFCGCHRAQFLARCCSCCTLWNYYNWLRATIFVRIFILTIHISMNSVPRTNRSRNRSVSACINHVAKWMRSNRFQLKAAKTEVLWSTTVESVIASCWCRSRRAHRRRSKSRHINWRWRVDEVTRSEDSIIMFRYSATTTLYPTINYANWSVLQSLMSFDLSRLDYGNATLPSNTGQWPPTSTSPVGDERRCQNDPLDIVFIVFIGHRHISP